MSTLCRATLNYFGAGGPVGVDVGIRDGRGAGLPGWSENGFELVGHPSAVGDWTDDVEIARVHYAEAEALARELTGADHALVSDHVKRTAEQARREREQAPVRLVHSDFAASYGDVVRTAYRDVHGRGAATLARNRLTAGDVEGAERIVMLQLWRNLGAPRMDLPLAFCDSRTVTPAETQPFHYNGYVAGGRSFDALGVRAPDRPDAHAWYAFLDMHPDEVVAFRTYDTDLVREGRTWFTPHSAFRDPDVEPGHPARFSIELRVMCLFG
ncbi:MAG TPA: CmcJ/NvfI family oxidoreductase [Acidimicrobiales bacterium]|nr:CmcJ/NvfI family oxidoreductase [Acidimicrobiales bacterium]